MSDASKTFSNLGFSKNPKESWNVYEIYIHESQINYWGWILMGKLHIRLSCNGLEFINLWLTNIIIGIKSSYQWTLKIR